MASRLSLPAGQSVREIAEQLGVTVEELQKHSGVDDAEAPLPAEKVIEIPDGFFKKADRDRRSTQAAVPETRTQAGMNSVLALQLEYRRTRIEGGQNKQAPTQNEADGLLEARRAYLRFEAPSNQLAIDLYRPLTQSRSIPVRAEAYAWQACAHALGYRLFGAEVGQASAAALSAAKAALMADPKSAQAHLGMAMARLLNPAATDLDKAQQEVERGLELDENNPWCWAELARMLVSQGDDRTGRQAAEIAVELEPNCPFAVEVLVGLDMASQSWDVAEERLVSLARAIPTYLHARMVLAGLYDKMQRADEAEELRVETLDQAEGDAYRRALLKRHGRVGN